MIDNNRPLQEWLSRQQNGGPMGDPPLTGGPGLSHPSQMPFSSRDYRTLTPEQHAERQKWVVDEAQRLISERQTTKLPTQVNQIHDPRPSGPTLQQRQVTDMSSQLIERLAQRDRGNGFF